MTILITNAAYLTTTGPYYNRPIIGWHSVLGPGSMIQSYVQADSIIEAGTAVGNLWNPDSASKFGIGATSATTRSITLDNATGAYINYIALAGLQIAPNVSGVNLNVVLIVHSSPDNATWTELTSSLIQLDSKVSCPIDPIMWYFPSATTRYWRVLIALTGSGYFRLGNVKLGRAMVLEHPVWVGAASPFLNIETDKVAQLSESGQYRGEVVTRRTRTASIAQRNCNPYFIRNDLKDFINHVNLIKSTSDGAPGPQGAFYLAWRPVDFPDEICYGWATNQIAPAVDQAQFAVSMSYQIDVRAVY